MLSSDIPRISQIIDQLCGMFSSSNSALHTRNGGLIGLAATAIALGQDVAPFLGVIIPPVLACFQDPESRVRYHACESLYNMWEKSEKNMTEIQCQSQQGGDPSSFQRDL